MLNRVCDIINGTSNNNISGSSSFCTSADFTITNFDPAQWSDVTWEVSPSSAGSINLVDSHTMSLTKSGHFNGPATITAVLDTENCGEISITRNIYMGRPVPQNNVTVTGPNNLNPGQTGVFNVNTNNFIGASSYNWTIFSNSFPNAGQYFELTQVNNATYTVNPDFSVPGGIYTVQARATNNCGFYPVQKAINVEEGDGVPVIYRTSNQYKIFPNPSTTFFNVSLADNKSSSTKSKEISGELFDSNGFMLKKIKFEGDQAKVDATNLRKGVYILRVYYDGVYEGHQVIID